MVPRLMSTAVIRALDDCKTTRCGRALVYTLAHGCYVLPQLGYAQVRAALRRGQSGPQYISRYDYDNWPANYVKEEIFDTKLNENGL